MFRARRLPLLPRTPEVIPRAIDIFTGKAFGYEDFEDEDNDYEGESGVACGQYHVPASPVLYTQSPQLLQLQDLDDDDSPQVRLEFTKRRRMQVAVNASSHVSFAS